MPETDTGANHSRHIYLNFDFFLYFLVFLLYIPKCWLKEAETTDRGYECKCKGRRKTVLAEEDRELADVIEIE